MCDNEESRLYYVLPIDNSFPYAYQHSSIRDVATICNILDLAHIFQLQNMDVSNGTLSLFEKAAENTVRSYFPIYEKGEAPHSPEANVGDLGFFLLLLLKCSLLYPSALPKNWFRTLDLVSEKLIERQTPDGGLEIFFDDSKKSYEQSAEAFYLPEALIGLIAVLEQSKKKELESAVKNGIAYLCRKGNRDRHLASDSSIFYFNWQAQLLFHWIRWKMKKEKGDLDLEAEHIVKLLEGIRKTRLSRSSFPTQEAAVAVACYFEGLAHAGNILGLLKLSTLAWSAWFEREIDRCLLFLYELQSSALQEFHGGFPHSRSSSEARVDVAGHVSNGLLNLLLS
jgi:hypothetical protein